MFLEINIKELMRKYKELSLQQGAQDKHNVTELKNFKLNHIWEEVTKIYNLYHGLVNLTNILFNNN